MRQFQSLGLNFLHKYSGRFFINFMELELTIYLYHDNISFRIIIGRQRMMFFINGISIKRIWFWTIILKPSMVMICKKYKNVIIFLLFFIFFLCEIFMLRCPQFLWAAGESRNQEDQNMKSENFLIIATLIKVSDIV